MNRTQDKLYKQYLESVPTGEVPFTAEEWFTEFVNAEEKEKADYLEYQKRVSENNAKSNGDKKESILPKADWIDMGKPTGKNKHDRFIDLAERRTTKALYAIENLKNLNSENYKSNMEERHLIIEALKMKLAEVEELYFKENPQKMVSGFSLRSD